MLKSFLINAAVFGLFILGVLAFDFGFSFESMESLAFKIYLIYGSALLFVINSVIAGTLVVMKRRAQARSMITGAFVVAIIGAIIGYVFPG